VICLMNDRWADLHKMQACSVVAYRDRRIRAYLLSALLAVTVCGKAEGDIDRLGAPSRPFAYVERRMSALVIKLRAAIA